MTRRLTLALASLALTATAGCQHPQHLNPTLACIRRHESDRGPWPHDRGYRAVESTGSSTASGAYQMVDGTWRSLSRSAGLGGRWRRAKDAPPWAQDAVAWWAITHGGRSHWSGTGCW